MTTHAKAPRKPAHGATGSPLRLLGRGGKGLLALLLAVLLAAWLPPAHAQLQWNYSFDANGNATATYPGNVQVGLALTGIGGAGIPGTSYVALGVNSAAAGAGGINYGTTLDSSATNCTGNVHEILFPSLYCVGVTNGNLNLISNNGSGNINLVGSQTITPANSTFVLNGTTAAGPANITGKMDGTQTFNLHGDNNWGAIMQGNSGASADLALMNRSAVQLKLPSTGGVQLLGAADASAGPAGYVGETIVASNPTVALTSTTTTNLATAALTAGDWDCRGTVALHPAGGTTVTVFSSGISTTSATLPNYNQGSLASIVATMPVGSFEAQSLAPWRVNVNAGTNVFVMASATFSGSTATADGYIACRRMR